MIILSLSASIGNLIVKESPEKRLRIFKTMQMNSFWLSGFFCFCLFFLLDEFVLLWLGPEFVFGFPVKMAILLSFYLSVILAPVVAFREATGLYQKTKYLLLAAAAIKIMLVILLSRYFGLAGILLATSIAKITTYAWYEPKLLFRDFFDSGSARYFCWHLLNIMLLAACIAAAHFFIPWREISSWAGWLIRGVACSVCINIVYLLIYFRTPEFRVVTNNIKKLIKKNNKS